MNLKTQTNIRVRGGHFTKVKGFTLKDKIGLIIILKEKMTKFIYEIRNKLVYERCEVIL